MDFEPGQSAHSNHPRRLTRLDRVFAEVSPVYFVTFNTYHRAQILARPEFHAAFVEFCERAQEFGVAAGRYVIMPDHVHLLVAMPELGSLSLSQWMKSFKDVLGKQLLSMGIDKPHWQEGFFDHLLRSEESHTQKWDYVCMNPVRAGLCFKPEDWPYQGEVIAI